ncbi:MAG: hypothetical protein FWF99_03075 [Desulfovibrionaceae bacterium]|nr:hypothetical protein [Desulfovibrionaceae bacterium]
MPVGLPEWLEQRELDPGPGAYEELPALFRAALKSQIAMLDKFWPSNPDRLRTRELYQFRAWIRIYPKDWAVFLLAPEYASPAGLIAAVLPAVAAGVEKLLICRVCPPGSVLPAPLSAALELLGQEYLYGLPGLEDAGLLEDLAAQNGVETGALALLGSEWTGGEGWLQRARALGLWFRSVPGRVKILHSSGGSASAALDKELLRWLHPQAEIIYPVEDRADSPVVPSAIPDQGDAGFFGAAGENFPGLITAPGQEAFWVWPEFSPRDFFRQSIVLTSLAASSRF